MNRNLTSELNTFIGESILLKGWASNIRFMGKLAFITLRDRDGYIQTVAEKSDVSEDIWKEIKSTTMESVIEIEGIVNERPENQIDKNSSNGNLELTISNYKILNIAKPLPIPVAGDGYEINEESRLKYRYLDLRRERSHKILELRSEFTKNMRNSLLNENFTEVETPILTASTKEGARDFVVPSRINKGKFYSLPQSPQQYKQLLMTAGVERYFQVAKCIRDEDLRADRGFEFTQVDLEASFVTQEELLQILEKVIIESVEKTGGRIKEKPFPRIPYGEAIEKYGADKFDLRSEEDKENGVLAFAWVVDFPFFKKVDSEDVAEVRDGKSGWTFTHNPFSMPFEENIDDHLQMKNIENIKTQQYDLVCNGYEVGGGSIRAHKAEILRTTYKIMGYTDEQIEESIGHMLKAFELGTPPHGGIAFGLDRLIMLLAGEESLKETIAFPMTYNGRTSVMDGPGEISEEQMKDLGLNSLGTEDPVQKVLNFLNSENVHYTHLRHEPTPTSEDSARVRNTKMEDATKALIMKGKKTSKNFMFVIQSHLKLDTKAAKELVGEPVEFENKDKIKEDYGIIVGGVHPFGNLLDLETYYDKGILDLEEVAFNCGTQEDSILMSKDDFVRLVGEDKFEKIGK